MGSTTSDFSGTSHASLPRELRRSSPASSAISLKGGGTAVYALDRDDVLEIALLEGGQPVEIIAFDKNGKSDLAALGLSGRAQPSGIQKILGGDSDDAARVRFGLFRRGLDIGRAQAARLFGRDTPAGESVTLKAERAAVVVLGAPAEPMTVWDQTPPSDVLVFIRRATPAPAGQPRLPEPLAEPRLEVLVNIASAESFEVSEGEYIQIIDVGGPPVLGLSRLSPPGARQGRGAGPRLRPRPAR